MGRSTLVAGLAAALASLLASGCGYHLQSMKHSPELEKAGVHKIYVAPVVNNTYKSGVQNVVYDAFMRALVSYSAVKLVSKPEDADAVLNISVNQAEAAVSSSTAASNLNSGGLVQVPANIATLPIANEYRAFLTCSFSLIKRNPRPGENAMIWNASIQRSNVFPGSNQLGTLGTTSPLINESEFDRTLFDVAQTLMLDAREDMLERF